jgi:GT2 family glycosyltransferase
MAKASFIIHFRKDCDARLENLKIIVKFYKKHFSSSEFIVVEDDTKPSLKREDFDKYLFLFNTDLYRRPLAYNMGAKVAKENILVFIDTDVIIDPSVLKDTLKSISNVEDFGYAIPYNGTSLYVGEATKKLFLENLDIKTLKKVVPSVLKTNHVENDVLVANTQSIGGCFIFTRQSFYRCGGFNPDFVAWGYEDNELKARCTNLGLKVMSRTEENAFLWHIPHPNTVKSNHAGYMRNQQINHIVSTMGKEKLSRLVFSFNPPPDEKFRQNAMKKSVAIVGPAPHIVGSKQKSKIDGYDEVVRINKALPIPIELKEDVGTKTTILYNCLNPSIECGGPYMPETWKNEGCKWIVCPYPPVKPFDADIARYIQTPQNDLIDFRTIDTRYYNTIFNSMKTRPNSGFLAILDVLSYPFEEIYVTGFSFFKGGYYSQYREKNEKQVMDFMAKGCGHQQTPQIEMMKHLYATDKRLKVDDYLHELLTGEKR